MPLHDWTKTEGWESVHHLWITELFHWIKPQLPEGYRAQIGTVPTMSISTNGNGAKPDVAERKWSMPSDWKNQPGSSSNVEQPDGEVALATINPVVALLIERNGFLVAAIELVSPRNKDRASSKEVYSVRYLGYLLGECNLLLIDVFPRPKGFSFFKYIGQELGMPGDDPDPPAAASYRVGESTPDDGRFVAFWRRPLQIGAVLPTIPLALTVHQNVSIDLETTYSRATSAAYLD